MEPATTDLFAAPRVVESTDECLFYHVMDLPEIAAPVHGWDLRGGEDAYLGGIPLEGRRVLEIGPASGFLTFAMEKQGAEVVAVELAPDREWDFVPQAGIDLATASGTRGGTSRPSCS